MSTSGFVTVNPSTGEQLETFSYFTPEGTTQVIDKADRTFHSFRKLSVHKRAQLFSSLGGARMSPIFHLAPFSR